MIQEEMLIHAVADSEAGAERPEFNPCRILFFDDDESAIGVEARLGHLIHQLDK
jgi:hypothetical protein